MKKITSITAWNQGKKESQVQKLLVDKIAMNIQCYNAVCFVDRVNCIIVEESDLLD